MTTPPAAWYDDPEDPTQYRYWDGSNWTEHRSPKQAAEPAETRTGGSAWNIFPEAFNTIGATWRQLLLLSVPNMIMSVILLVAVYAAVDQIFTGDLDEVIDRAADGVISAADERYFETLDITFPVAMFWVALGALVVTMLVGVVMGAAIQRMMAASMRGTVLEPSEAFSGALRRLGRLIGWPFVLILSAMVAAVPAILFPPLLLLYVPLVIWLWPYLIAVLPTLALAPAGQNPIVQTRVMLRGRWGDAAVRCLVLTLLWLTVSFGASIVNQMFIFDLRASVIGSTLTGAIQGVLTAAGLVAWWVQLDGPLDPELDALAESTDPSDMPTG